MAIDLRGRTSVSFYDTFAEFPITGSNIVLYVDRDTLTMYIWNGTAYEPFSGGGGGGSTITIVANYSALPDPTTVSGQFYWCSASQGTYWLPGSLGGTYYSSGLYYSNGVGWEYTPTPYNATQATVNAGTVNDQFITPKTFNDSSQLASKVAKSDYTPAHSILAQQSGTGSPTAVTIGTNEILGRESGGGADIKGLNASEVKAILAFTKAEIMAGLEMEEIYVTGDQTTPSTTAVSIIDLVTTTLTTGKYKINGTIGVGSSSTAGLKLGVILPTGATMKLKGLDRGSTTANSITEIFTTSNTLSTGNFCPTNGESIVNINGTITIGATSGVVQFIFAKTTSGTATIYDEGTQLTIEKL